MQYVVQRRCSTRRSIDPASPDFEQWVNLNRGDRVDATDLPKHAPLKDWLASGHLAALKEKKGG